MSGLAGNEGGATASARDSQKPLWGVGAASDATRKYLHSQPSNQLLKELRHIGLPISAGTLSGLLEEDAGVF